MNGYWLSAVGCRLGLLIVAMVGGLSSFAQLPERPDFAQHIEPMLQQLCYDCHGNGAAEGGLQLDTSESVEALIANQKLWGKVWDNVLTETMPPADMDQPTEDQRNTLSRWIAQTVFHLNPESPDPGRVTIRRLNRAEYRYSVLDLLGIDFNVDEHFPVDDTGYGFDTIGDVLTVPPTLMDKYFVAAERISEQYAVKESLSDQKLVAEPAEAIERARELLETIATRAYRQPVDKSTIEKLLDLTRPEMYAGEASVRDMVTRALVAILVSPRFIYRAEFQPRPDDPSSVHPIDEYALASRLSYFLWSSLPDEKLLKLASEGRLRDELASQVDRMLHDEKSSRFVDNFVGQWLLTRDVKAVYRSRKMHRQLNRLRDEMREETHTFFAHIMRDNRDVIELITANYSFLDEDLAFFYGVAGVDGEEFRRVEFDSESPRGGILTHASVLLVTSTPNRTSPVKRGRFVLDNILGTPSPPAPPDVPDLEEVTKGVTWHISMREQLALHREDPACASCHDRMDPLGLGLEHFDAIGRYREDYDGFPIDATGQLVSGEEFSGVRELREILGNKRRLFYRCLTKKLMTYSLGRGIDYTDNPTIEAIVDAMMAEDSSGVRGRFSTMLMGIVESPQFQLRRGNGGRGNRGRGDHSGVGESK